MTVEAKKSEPNAHRIELALRAGMLAKAVLGLLGMSNVTVARLQFIEVVQELKGVDELLSKWETTRG